MATKEINKDKYCIFGAKSNVKFMGETIVSILAIIGLYTVLKKLGCVSFIVALVIVIIAAALFFKP